MRRVMALRGGGVASIVFALGVLATPGLAADAPKGRPVDEVLNEYIHALGGQAALDRIQTREVEARRHRGPKLTYYWQRPSKVLLVEGKERIGWDGGSGWMLSKKQRVTKLSKSSHWPLETDANPVRYANLKQLYPDVTTAAPEVLNGRQADVLISPNELGATKLYFDRESHLLVRVEEKGEVSAYFKTVTDFEDYQTVDGIKLPFRITHSSDEPGAQSQVIQISEVRQNVPIRPEIFAKPNAATVTLGGKR